MILPILRLENVLLASVHRQLDDDDAATFQAELLAEVQKWEAEGVVLDLSAVRVIDSFMSRLLGQIVTSCRVMGARPVYCGVAPEVAVTLVEMGRDLRGVDTATTLGMALELLGLRLVVRQVRMEDGANRELSK